MGGSAKERGHGNPGTGSRSNDERRKGIAGFLLRAVWAAARLSFKGLKTDAGRIGKRTFAGESVGFIDIPWERDRSRDQERARPIPFYPRCLKSPPTGIGNCTE